MPLSLSSDEMEIILAAAAPLPLPDRDPFLQAVAGELGKLPATAIGPGSVGRAVRETQRQFLNRPAFRGSLHPGSKYGG